MKKEILLITNLARDDEKIRKELEKCAIKVEGNLNGFRLSEDKKVMYLFQFQSQTKMDKFKEMEFIKNYNLVEKN